LVYPAHRVQLCKVKSPVKRGGEAPANKGPIIQGKREGGKKGKSRLKEKKGSLVLGKRR